MVDEEEVTVDVEEADVDGGTEFPPGSDSSALNDPVEDEEDEEEPADADAP